jgi:PAS domain S-box-containing protein
MKTNVRSAEIFEHIEQKLASLSSEIHQSSTLNKVKELRSLILALDEKNLRPEPENSKNEDLYKQIFEEVPIGIMHYDKEGMIDACNRSFINILDSTWEKLNGLNINEVQNINVRHAMEQALEGQLGEYEGMYTSVTSGKRLPIQVEFHP